MTRLSLAFSISQCIYFLNLQQLLMSTQGIVMVHYSCLSIQRASKVLLKAGLIKTNCPQHEENQVLPHLSKNMLLSGYIVDTQVGLRSRLSHLLCHWSPKCWYQNCHHSPWDQLVEAGEHYSSLRSGGWQVALLCPSP